jgi:hypothetical protein
MARVNYILAFMTNAMLLARRWRCENAYSVSTGEGVGGRWATTTAVAW